VRHFLRHDHQTVRQFRSLNVTHRLIHMPIVSHVRQGARLDGGEVSMNWPVLELKEEHGNYSAGGGAAGLDY
jgi:hypothetical protein